MQKYYRESSRGDVYQDAPEGVALPDSALKVGCLMRIADACELMAKDRASLERENKSLRESKEADARYIRTLERRVAALRGCLKRAKKKGGR